MIEFEFNTDPDSTIHFEKHGVTLKEIDEFFNEIEYLERKRKDKSFVGYGKLRSGRYLYCLQWTLSCNCLCAGHGRPNAAVPGGQGAALA